MATPKLVVTVCTANICRSPMAEALLRHALAAQPEPLRSIKVVSAGVAARAGDTISANSVTALKKVGIDLASHRSQPLTDELVRRADLVLCMTEGHLAAILANVSPTPRHVFLFRDFLPAGAEREIGDPFGGSLPLYEACRDEMVEAVPSIVEHLRQLAGLR
jgi:protein-tyrosine-phosphatase